MMTSSIEGDSDAVQAQFLFELVVGLTATRNEPSLRRTIDCWKARVRAGGLDPDALIDLVRRAYALDRENLSCDSSLIAADKREFVLVCLEVYVRNTTASRSAPSGAGSDEQHRNLAVPDHMLRDAPEYQSA
jgi:hypothetical protein